MLMHVEAVISGSSLVVSHIEGRAGSYTTRCHDEVQDEHSGTRKSNREEAWRAVLNDGVHNVLWVKEEKVNKMFCAKLLIHMVTRYTQTHLVLVKQAAVHDVVEVHKEVRVGWNILSSLHYLTDELIGMEFALLIAFAQHSGLHTDSTKSL